MMNFASWQFKSMISRYLKEPEKTKAALDDGEDGFLRSGDVGVINDDGFVSITGRIKEILITAGGENVPPVPIEDNIKVALPCVSNVIVIGRVLIRYYLQNLLCSVEIIKSATKKSS